MAELAFDLSNSTITPSGAAVFSSQSNQLILRRWDQSTGKYAPTGLLSQNGAVVRTAAINAHGLKEIFNLDIQVDYDKDSNGSNLGSVLCRLSLDNGATFRYWDGTAWSAATTSSHFSTISAAQANILTFPFPTSGYTKPRLELKLLPDASLKHTPRVCSAFIGVEIHDRPFEDAVSSVLTHLASTPVKLVASNFMASSSSTVRFADVWTRFTVTQILRVHNITDDPGRRVNLLQSYSTATGNITLTTVVAENKEVEVEYIGTCPVSPMAEDELQAASIPHIGVTPLQTRRNENFDNWTEIVVNKAANFARIRTAPDVFDQSFRTYCVAARNEEALQLAEAVSRRIEDEFFTYLPTGERMTLCEIRHPDNLDFEPRGLYSKQIEFTVQFRRYAHTYAQTGLVQSITATITDRASTSIFDTAQKP